MKITSRGPSFYYIFLPLFLIFFAVPYLFDLAFCEELYATPLSQAALIDAEKVDPSDRESFSTSLDYATESDVTVASPPTCFAWHLSFEGSSFTVPIPVSLTSRPPPAS
jgi:hypothetical protein